MPPFALFSFFAVDLRWIISMSSQYDLKSHFVLLGRNANRSATWKCLYCSFTLTGSTERQESHLSGTKIAGSKSVNGSKTTRPLSAPQLTLLYFLFDQLFLKGKQLKRNAKEKKLKRYPSQKRKLLSSNAAYD
jgi:hypothetical protein